MKIETIPYKSYEKGLPQAGNWILGQEQDDTIIVYQAFNHQIADYAVANQRFGGSAYSFTRMTWIKPNFLWMMFRAGWASKENQERILAIRMSKNGFIQLLEEGVYTIYTSEKYESKESWQAALSNSEVRIQWDPDHDPSGKKIARRALQIGIKGSRVEQFNNEFIQEIIDITAFVKQQKDNFDNKSEDFLVINESIVDVPPLLKQKYSIPDTFIQDS